MDQEEKLEGFFLKKERKKKKKKNRAGQDFRVNGNPPKCRQATGKHLR